MIRRVSPLAPLALLVLLAGCTKDPDFQPVTTAPPGAVAELHQDKSNHTQSIRLTEGVAIAVECLDGKDRPCSFDGTTIDDASVATFRRAYSDLQQQIVHGQVPGQTSYLDRTVFLVVGKKPGRTTMTIRTGYGDVPMTIEILPAPAS